MNVLKSRALLVLLICLFYPSCSVADTLGRLFFTPQDRVYLEQLRWSPPESLPFISEQQQEKVSASDNKPEVITLDGTVMRSNGTQVVWLNGVSYNGADLPENVRLHQPFTAGQIELRVEEKGKFYSLRPGQILDVDSGQIRELYERGATVSVHGNDPTDEDPEPKQHAAVELSPEPPSVPARDPASSLPLKSEPYKKTLPL